SPAGSEGSVCTEEELHSSLQYLSLDDELVPARLEGKTIRRITSDLRPEAEPFTPQHIQWTQSANPTMDALITRTPASFPSSPPLLIPPQSMQRASSLLPSTYFDTSSARTPRAGFHQRYLDGTYSVYDDSLSPDTQPQIPADIERQHHVNAYNAAYTAPPGTTRSSTLQRTHTMVDVRKVSGEVSPTRQAHDTRERHRREMMRSVHVSRTRRREDDTAHEDPPPHGDLRLNIGYNPGREIWRDELNADGVGDENFEEVRLVNMPIRSLRSISGNRYASG
ncbi:hypothetical protein LTR66_017058, partial [Elasticomyces elasticus]